MHIRNIVNHIDNSLANHRIGQILIFTLPQLLNSRFEESHTSSGRSSIPIKIYTIGFCTNRVRLIYAIKLRDALIYETSLSIASGAGCSIGDQMHPLCEMNMATYNLIGKAYSLRSKPFSCYASTVPRNSASSSNILMQIFSTMYH